LPDLSGTHLLFWSLQIPAKTKELKNTIIHPKMTRAGSWVDIRGFKRWCPVSPSKQPAELSGGQKQRVAIARAIAIKPRLLLFDEPTSALDPEMTAEVLDVIGELRAEGRDFVLVTHQMGFARRVADQVAFLSEGRILEQGVAAELFERPGTAGCRAFLERVLNY
jgi:ABC-type histidine transport system ATPase subunit